MKAKECEKRNCRWLFTSRPNKYRLHFCDKDAKTLTGILVAGNATRTAENLITQYLHDTVADYEIADITETKILEVYIVKDSSNGQ